VTKSGRGGRDTSGFLWESTDGTRREGWKAKNGWIVWMRWMDRSGSTETLKCCGGVFSSIYLIRSDRHIRNYSQFLVNGPVCRIIKPPTERNQVVYISIFSKMNIAAPARSVSSIFCAGPEETPANYKLCLPAAVF